ncbi:uncharacterized [Tachysurus ichikawai]
MSASLILTEPKLKGDRGSPGRQDTRKYRTERTLSVTPAVTATLNSLRLFICWRLYVSGSVTGGNGRAFIARGRADD